MTQTASARPTSRHRRSDLHQQPIARRPGTRLARRGGTALAVIATLTCGITTLLLASGLAVAGGGLLGNVELAVLGAVVPATVLTWRAAARRRRRRDRIHARVQGPAKEASP